MPLLTERKTGRIMSGSPWRLYEVKPPELAADEREVYEAVIGAALRDYSSADLQELFMRDRKKELFVEQVVDLAARLKQFSGSLFTAEQEKAIVESVTQFVNEVFPKLKKPEKVVRLLIQDLVGLGKLTPLLEDDELEEVMVNGPKQEAFVIDRRYGPCKSNVRFESVEELTKLVQRIAMFVGKTVSPHDPLLDARLPDGSRVNATVQPAAPFGPAITIRKFKKRPMSIVDVIESGTMPSEVAAFLWLAVDGMGVRPMNLLVSGITGSGKTTTLNSLSIFVPPSERIVTIEDTLELNLSGRENWVQLESKPGVREEPIVLDDLLKNALRMRPDRIFVGEVRGSEALTMFVAMDLGHRGLMSTLHANSAQETILRLQSPPMSVPVSLFTLLDLVIMQHRLATPQGMVRRITQVSEVSVLGENVLLNNVYDWNRERFALERTQIPSQMLEKLGFHLGKTRNDVKRELDNRTKVLDFLVRGKVRDPLKIQEIINAYIKAPSKVLESIG
ncbi:CpaF family protein [Candidatus Micrarchaeota archaeon]|nr:CpaF family protein [Candidatus Micrarchaeota archaeon]